MDHALVAVVLFVATGVAGFITGWYLRDKPVSGDRYGFLYQWYGTMGFVGGLVGTYVFTQGMTMGWSACAGALASMGFELGSGLGVSYGSNARSTYPNFPTDFLAERIITLLVGLAGACGAAAGSVVFPWFDASLTPISALIASCVVGGLAGVAASSAIIILILLLLGLWN